MQNVKKYSLFLPLHLRLTYSSQFQCNENWSKVLHTFLHSLKKAVEASSYVKKDLDPGLLNPSQANVSYLYPMKTFDFLKFSGRIKMECLVEMASSGNTL